jgi:hypothetical protein
VKCPDFVTVCVQQVPNRPDDRLDGPHAELGEEENLPHCGPIAGRDAKIRVHPITHRILRVQDRTDRRRSRYRVPCGLYVGILRIPALEFGQRQIPDGGMSMLDQRSHERFKHDQVLLSASWKEKSAAGSSAAL